jgi:hypothetical protein
MDPHCFSAIPKRPADANKNNKLKTQNKREHQIGACLHEQSKRALSDEGHALEDV